MKYLEIVNTIIYTTPINLSNTYAYEKKIYILRTNQSPRFPPGALLPEKPKTV